MFILVLAAVAVLGAVLGFALPVRLRWPIGIAAALALLYMFSLAGTEVALVGPIVGGAVFAAWFFVVAPGRVIRARTHA